MKIFNINTLSITPFLHKTTNTPFPFNLNLPLTIEYPRFLYTSLQMEFTYRKLSLPAIVEKATVQDPLFITRFAKHGSQGQIISKFKIVVNPDDNNFAPPFYILQLNEDQPDSENDNSDTDSDTSEPPQQFFECHIVGEIKWAILGPYGDWVPEGE